MLREIRDTKGFTIQEMADRLNVTRGQVAYWEKSNNTSSVAITNYINHAYIPIDVEEELRIIRRSNWEYRDDLSPITNELRRIRNGLGRTAKDLSLMIGKNPEYWIVIENKSRPLPEEDLDTLNKHFNLSSTTIKRLRIVEERMNNGQPTPDAYRYENPEIEEPLDLYDDDSTTIDPAEYLDLLRMIEDENGGSIAGVSEDDPKLQRLRQMMGVIYYDEDEESERMCENVGWFHIL